MGGGLTSSFALAFLVLMCRHGRNGPGSLTWMVGVWVHSGWGGDIGFSCFIAVGGGLAFRHQGCEGSARRFMMVRPFTRSLDVMYVMSCEQVAWW